eukprot:g1037.t1
MARALSAEEAQELVDACAAADITALETLEQCCRASCANMEKVHACPSFPAALKRAASVSAEEVYVANAGFLCSCAGLSGSLQESMACKLGVHGVLLEMISPTAFMSIDTVKARMAVLRKLEEATLNIEVTLTIFQNQKGQKALAGLLLSANGRDMEDPLMWQAVRIVRNIAIHGETGGIARSIAMDMGKLVAQSILAMWKASSPGFESEKLLWDILWSLSVISCPGLPIVTPSVSRADFTDLLMSL